jgi:histidinol-phosphate aminotransferase
MNQIYFRKKDLKAYIPKKIPLENVIRLSLSENLYGPSPKALKAVSEEINRMNFYPENSYEDLVELLAKRINIDKSKIALGNGSDELIFLSVLSCMRLGEIGITSCSTFAGFKFAVANSGGICVEVPLKNFCIDICSIIETVKTLILENKRVNIIYLCNPNNPTGTVVEYKDIELLVNFAKQNSIYLLFDEAYIDYAIAEGVISVEKYLKNHPKIAILRTFSKFYALAGLRCGYVFGDENIINKIKVLRNNLVFNVNRIAHTAAYNSLIDEEFVTSTSKLNMQNKLFLVKNLKEMNIEFIPSKTNFVLVKIGYDHEEFCNYLQTYHNILVANCKKFGLDGYVRIGVGKTEDMKKFIIAFKAYKSQ